MFKTILEKIKKNYGIYYFYTLIILTLLMLILPYEKSVEFTSYKQYNSVTRNYTKKIIYDGDTIPFSVKTPGSDGHWVGYLKNDSIYKYRTKIGKLSAIVYYFGSHDADPMDYNNGSNFRVRVKKDDMDVDFWIAITFGLMILIGRIIAYNVDYEYSWRISSDSLKFMKKKWFERNLYFVIEYFFVVFSSFHLVNFFITTPVVLVGLITYIVVSVLYGLVITDNLDEYLFKKVKIKEKTDAYQDSFNKLIAND